MKPKAVPICSRCMEPVKWTRLGGWTHRGRPCGRGRMLVKRSRAAVRYWPVNTNTEGDPWNEPS